MKWLGATLQPVLFTSGADLLMGLQAASKLQFAKGSGQHADLVNLD
jgi:hypothetical protein